MEDQQVLTKSNERLTNKSLMKMSADYADLGLGTAAFFRLATEAARLIADVEFAEASLSKIHEAYWACDTRDAASMRSALQTIGIWSSPASGE